MCFARVKAIRYAFICLALGALSARIHGTEADSASRVDTVLFKPVLDDSPAMQVDNPADFEKHLYQSPTVALFKSMLVPGLGQLGNRRYVKAAVIIGLEVWSIRSAIRHGQDAADYKDQYDSTPVDSLALRNKYYAAYQDQRDERNKFIWYAGITIFVSMFDAYVDAHLSGSPSKSRNDRFSWEVTSDGRGGASAILSYSF